MSAACRQTGTTLVVALIFLVLLTLLGVGAYQTSLTDQQVSGNVQLRNEALNAAQEAIEVAISSDRFALNPQNALATPCGEANTYCTDHNSDGVAEYRTRLAPAPACIATQAAKVAELDVGNAEDLSCVVSQSQHFGIASAAAASSDSLCANTIWQITAQASATGRPAKVTVSQGVGVRVSADDMTASCL